MMHGSWYYFLSNWIISHYIEVLPWVIIVLGSFFHFSLIDLFKNRLWIVLKEFMLVVRTKTLKQKRGWWLIGFFDWHCYENSVISEKMIAYGGYSKYFSFQRLLIKKLTIYVKFKSGAFTDCDQHANAPLEKKQSKKNAKHHVILFQAIGYIKGKSCHHK